MQNKRLNGLNGNLAALALGDPEGMPVLALHGWLDNAASFIPLSRPLPEYRIVALDFPGHGHSDHRPAGVVYHFVDYVADVAHAALDLGWERFTLLGHSLGANVAVVFAATYPELVDRLVLIDGVGPTAGVADDAPSRLRKSIDVGLHPRAARRGSYTNWDALVAARQQASPIGVAGAELLVRRGAREHEGEIRLRADRRLRQPSPMYLEEDVVSAFVDRVEAPTLLILAREGQVITREVTHQRIARFRDIHVEDLPGQHHLHMDDPEPVAAAIRDFIG